MNIIQIINAAILKLLENDCIPHNEYTVWWFKLDEVSEAIEWLNKIANNNALLGYRIDDNNHIWPVLSTHAIN